MKHKTKMFRSDKQTHVVPLLTPT